MKTGIAGIISILLSLSFVTTSQAQDHRIPKDQIIMGEQMLSNDGKAPEGDISGPEIFPPTKFCTKDCIVIVWKQMINDRLAKDSE